jgi:Domain of unknown function (DUF4173)
MNTHRDAALPLAAAALGLGVAGDLLLRAMPLGIGVLIWVVLFLAAAQLLLLRRATLVAAAGALATSAGLAWRDAHALRAIDVLLTLGFLGCISLRARGVRVWATGILRAAAALAMTALLSIAGMFELFLIDAGWRELQPGRAARRAFVVLRGALIALPMLVIFTMLLTSADAAFASILANLFRIDIPQLLGHVFLTIAITLPVGGLFRSTRFGAELPDVQRPAFLRLGAPETNVALGLIDVLFAAFVGVQIRYFFGGAALVRVAPNLTYADYARRGFFELVTVAALVVPLLLVGEWIIDKSSPRAVTTMRLLAAGQILLVAVMLVSAFRRMQLYVAEYGLTELRLYTTAFMFLLGALLVWFAATVLTGHRERFFAGAVICGLITVVTLHAINPDDLIVRTPGKHPLDMSYVTSLSADATPALLPMATSTPCLAKRLLAMDGKNEDGDWRTWNASRAAAHRAVAAQRVQLARATSGCR